MSAARQLSCRKCLSKEHTTKECPSNAPYCNKCGERGHIYKTCTGPTTSCGVAVFNYKDECLMVCRRDSISFVEFMRGRDTNMEHILRKVTTEELHKIAEKRPDVSITDISGWATPEWGWPKGRLAYYPEANIYCAMRELYEEVGLQHTHYTFLDIHPIIEEFTGTDGQKYKHIIFLARLTDEGAEIKLQEKEISRAAWMSLDDIHTMFRPYEAHKMCLLQKIKAFFGK